MRRLGLLRARRDPELDRARSYYWSARSTLCGAVVRLAHQLISGSSVTACHNPACTAQTIEETGSHFLPARETPIVSSTTRHPASGALIQGSKARKSALSLSFGSGDDYSLGNEASLDIAPERDRELAGQGDQHDAPDPARLAARLLDVPMRERAGGLMFLPEPCDFDQDAPSPAISSLGYSLAPCHRSTVIGARRQAEIRSQLPSVREGPGEHLARKDCRASPAHS